MRITVGSTFTGYDGIGLALESLFPIERVWFSEYEPPTPKQPKPEQGPSKILAHHWPEVPNLGDITQIDWSTVRPVDILTGGFPCQDLSLAGRRAGMTTESRSGLWSYMAAGIKALRPKLVVIENVRGLLSAEALSEVEPCTFCLGDGGCVDVRALGVVLADLAGIGYDAEWVGLRASDIGAPHERFRVFLIAHPAGERWDGWPQPVEPSGTSGRFGNPDAAAVPHPEGERWGTHPIPDADSEYPIKPELVAERIGPAVPERDSGTQVTPDAIGIRQLEARRPTNPQAQGSGPRDASQRCDRVRDIGPFLEEVDPDPDSGGCQSVGWIEPQQRDIDGSGCAHPIRDRAESAASINWAEYEPAIRLWESVLARPAPAPTAPNKRGNHRLAVPFDEWVMGVPAGHVSDPAIPITYNARLKALGNGVVPPQAAFAISHLLNRAAA